MDLRRLFVGAYQELRRPTNAVDESLMTRIEKARQHLRLQGKDVTAVLGPRPERPKPTPLYALKRAASPASGTFGSDRKSA
jgi:hypothetical protein